MADAVLVDQTHTECVTVSRPSPEPTLRSTVHESRWRPAQAAWAALPVTDRLQVLKRARHGMAEQADSFASAISADLARTSADTLVAELLPLLEACRFLERQAVKIFAPRRLGRRGLPFWLTGLSTEVQRVPYGKILVIGPANYPLFLPGVQTVQALAAGNAVVWKPGRGGKAVADLVSKVLHNAGLPRELLHITAESIEAGQSEIEAGPDKVFFTGSAEVGCALSRQLAASSTPCVMELSGCDAVVVLASADWKRVTKALAFGMRLNGSRTCMAPRRIFMVGASPERREKFIGHLLTELDWIDGVRLTEETRRELSDLLQKTSEAGAVVHGEVASEQQPIVITNVSSSMQLARADLFAPVLMVMETADEAHMVDAIADCPYALTAAIFGNEREARALAQKITAGTILVNDLIVPTADPRVPFGGRRQSGFGVTRGAEGLLEMTAVKVVAVRRGKSTKHFETTTKKHEGLFHGIILSSHAGTGRQRWQGLKQLIAAARTLKGK